MLYRYITVHLSSPRPLLAIGHFQADNSRSMGVLARALAHTKNSKSVL